MAPAVKHNILVTGASGPLGRQLVEQLYFDKGVNFVLATASGPRPYFFEEFSSERFAYTQINLTKGREVSNLFHGALFRDQNIDTVIHLAFKTQPNESDADRSHKLNIDSTRMLIDHATQSESVKKFIFRSSHQVYRLTSQSSVFLKEESDLNFEASANQWIRDRVDADMLCRAHMGGPNLDIVVLRLSNLMGMNVRSQLYWLLHGAAAHTPMGYNPMMNLLHTKDAVRAFQLATHKS